MQFIKKNFHTTDEKKIGKFFIDFLIAYLASLSNYQYSKHNLYLL